ncbi:MAG: CapA family protein [Myxococcales bacterium]|nr:CapA family protein [Myxococcales bacterium]
MTCGTLGACQAPTTPARGARTALAGSQLAPEAQHVRLWFGGDVHVGAGRAAPLLTHALPLLARARGVINLEGPIASQPTRQRADRRWLLFNAPSVAAQLARAGVAVATLANNHAGDDGPSGRARTRSVLAAADLRTADDAQPARLAGAIVAAVDLSRGLPADLAASLQRARGSRDSALFAVAFHVAHPPSYLPSPRLARAVDIAIAAGARVVVAHGTHELARIERRGDAVIAWGLGNLVFACRCSRAREGLLLYVARRGKHLAAAVAPIDVGREPGQPARPSRDAAGVFELLRALESSPFDVKGGVAWIR